MLQKIQLQTANGLKDYLFISDSFAYDQAKADGLIVEGMEVVYRGFLVHILPDMSMLILSQVAPMMSEPAFTPDMSGCSFTINGVPVTPEQFNAAMGGMPQ